MTLPRYAAYKDSGVQWLGEVPAHWQACAAKRWIASRAGGTLIKGECASEPGEGLVPAFSASGQDVWVEAPAYHQPGVVLSAVGARCGKTFKADGAWGVVANTHCLFPLQSASRDFVWYLTNQEDWWERGGTAQPFIKVSETLARTWAFPPPEEQAAIATFLDRETAKIDALIAEQEKLIALLAEKRQATISHAVTKGLNPDAPMKDSGVPWLGEVPAHWKVVSLGRITESRCDGPFGSGIKSEHYTETGALVVRLQNIKSGAYNMGDPVFLDENYFRSQLRNHDVLPGDVLVAGLGDENNLLGRACVAPSGLGPALVKADCFRFRLQRERCDPEFVAWQLSAGAAYDAGVLATGTTRSRMPLGTMASRRLALPPIAEQRDIASSITIENRRIDALRSQSEEAVELLRERRSALIAAAVTGQIDVRAAVSAEAA